jgi:hypothetical protein
MASRRGLTNASLSTVAQGISDVSRTVPGTSDAANKGGRPNGSKTKTAGAAPRTAAQKPATTSRSNLTHGDWLTVVDFHLDAMARNGPGGWSQDRTVQHFKVRDRPGGGGHVRPPVCA